MEDDSFEGFGLVASTFMASDSQAKKRFFQNSIIGFITGLLVGSGLVYLIGIPLSDLKLFSFIILLCGLLGIVGGVFITASRVMTEASKKN